MSTSGNESEFSGEITVASRIIDQISSGLYKSPASCLKELINNSYDADASRVDIYVKPDADRIILEDDGVGINKDEFVRHFKRISESHKRDTGEITKKGRKKIGKIGIGFIAANELCDIMQIFSTKEGSTELLNVEIDFGTMRKPPEEREAESGDVTKADYTGTISEVDASAHYTQIFLKYVRGEARDILAGAKSQKTDGKPKSIYGLSHDSVARLLKANQLKEWKEFDTYSETMLKIALNVPVRYHDSWLPEKYQKKLRKFIDMAEGVDFEVFYDGAELRKPIVFTPGNKRAFVETFEIQGEHVSAEGYFYVQHGTIKPFELHGLLTRIRGAAVGEYDQQFLEFPTSESSLMQRWVSAEMWADDRLEQAMNIDRRTLRDTHPAYVELRKEFHKRLRKVLRRALKELYERGSGERKTEQTQKLTSDLSDVITEELKEESPELAKQLKRAIKKYSEPGTGRNILLKKYNVVELYELVLDTAKNTLSKTQLERFIKALTERLGSGN